MKIAAIWARVSSRGQEEISPEGQVERVKTKLTGFGYIPQHIFKVVWTSTDLKPCPQFQELTRLIRTKQIQAVGMLDRDRIEADGLQRLIFLATCRENGIEPIVYQGVPFLEGPEGQITEMALALAKAKQVERAQSGAKQGLEDRAWGRGKQKQMMPPTKRRVYGMKWQNDKYVPDENYDNARLIFELALSGMKLKPMCKELLLQGIATSQNKVFWQPSSLRAILTNPVYAGRVGTIRYEKVLPKRRRKNTFGKTSFRIKPIEEWHFLDGLVEQPIVTWQEWLAVQERLKLNRQYASRNAHHDFLLRGLIQCQTCYEQGFDRHYYGLGRDQVYVCSVAKECRSKAIPCSDIEDGIKAKITSFLESPGIWFKEANNRLANIPDIEQRIKDNEKQYQKTLDDERYKLEKLSPEAFEQEKHLLIAKRKWLKKENDRLNAQLANIRKHNLKQEMVIQMKENLKANLDSATNEDWRSILESLCAKIMAFEDGTWDIEINIPVTPIENKIGWCTFPC